MYKTSAEDKIPVICNNIDVPGGIVLSEIDQEKAPYNFINM